MHQALFVANSSIDENAGNNDDDDKASIVLLMHDDVMPDDRLDARRREFTDERREHVLAQTYGGECTDGIQESGGEIGHHTPDQHDNKALAAAVLVDLCEEGAFGNRLLRRLAEVEAHEDECNRHADGLRDAGENDAGHNSKEDDIRRREDDGRREAERVRKEGEEKGENDRPLTE